MTFFYREFFGSTPFHQNTGFENSRQHVCRQLGFLRLVHDDYTVPNVCSQLHQRRRLALRTFILVFFFWSLSVEIRVAKIAMVNISLWVAMWTPYAAI